MEFNHHRHHHRRHSDEEYGDDEEEYDSPPVRHVSHESGEESYGDSELHHRHPAPHHGGEDSSIRQETYRILTKAGEELSLTIREGEVVLARDNPNDEYQHWIKDMTYSTRVKDEDGFPAFSLVNKVTGEAIKHSFGQSKPVRLIKNNPNYLDESVLWTESNEYDDGFRSIRMVNNAKLVFDAFNGDKKHGGVKEGTFVALWEFWKGDNQLWKIVPR